MSKFDQITKLVDSTLLLAPTLELIKEHDQPKVIALVATRGVGKSYLLRKLIDYKGYPTIIVDKNFQKTWDDIAMPMKKVENLTKWERKEGVIRIKGDKIVERLTEVFNTYNDEGNVKTRIALVMEDCGVYTSTLGETKLLKGLCASVRHANAHIFLVLHDLESIHNKLKPELDAIILFKTKDEQKFFSRKRRFRNEQELSDAFDILNKDTTPKHTHYVINLD